jgi:hypothetical protein
MKSYRVQIEKIIDMPEHNEPTLRNVLQSELALYGSGESVQVTVTEMRHDSSVKMSITETT